MLPSWIIEYIGIPFVDLGRDHIGCDCYGLVRLVLAEHFGIELPLFTGEYADPFDRVAVGSLISKELPLLCGDRLAGPELGAVAVAQVSDTAFHLGLSVGENMILHAREGKGVVLERASSSFFSGRLEGYYRVRAPRR